MDLALNRDRSLVGRARVAGIHGGASPAYGQRRGKDGLERGGNGESVGGSVAHMLGSSEAACQSGATAGSNRQGARAIEELALLS